MLIRFLKRHIDWKAGDEANVDNTQGQYLIRCHVAEPVDADPENTEAILLNHLEENKPKNFSELSETEQRQAQSLLHEDYLLKTEGIKSKTKGRPKKVK